MLSLKGKPKPRRKHPNSAEAAEALLDGRCLYSQISMCSGRRKVRAVGLRNQEDEDTVLVCGAHYARQRKIPDRDLEKLRRDLRSVFASKVLSP
jgi:hypothetical protein